MAKYRLTSSPLVHTPGIIAWAINGYAFAGDRPQLRRLIRETYRLPDDAARKLLSGQVPHTVDGDAVTFEA